MNKIIGMPGLIRIDHIGIAVYDLDAAIEWYTKFLGAKMTFREINREQMVEEANLILGEFVFQLLMPTNELSKIRKFLESRGPGLQQVAIQVTNLDEAVKYALDNHVRVIYDTPRRGTGNSQINFLHPKDCFGVLIELIEK